jgi:hypothetical protein
MERKYTRGYNHYWHAIDSLPSYMAKNLKEMPNNKGYRWKGVVFYGSLTEQKDQPQIVFEKSPQGLIIHEIRRDGSYKQTLKQHNTKPNDKNSYRGKYNDVPGKERNNFNRNQPDRNQPDRNQTDRNQTDRNQSDKKPKRKYTKPPQKKLLQVKKS